MVSKTMLRTLERLLVLAFVCAFQWGCHPSSGSSRVAGECSECHGGIKNSAPPRDTLGRKATIEVTVGAHQAHLGRSGWHREVLCDDCHVVPEDRDDPGHIDASPAEVIWGMLAQAGGAVPSFDRATASCSGVYCHGATLDGAGTNTQPTWTMVDGTQAVCGSCHGLTLPPPHPTSSACGACHGMVVDNGLRFVDPSRHINGVVDVEMSDLACFGCHGSLASAAPPTDVAGNASTTEITVGAHQSHLRPSNWHREVSCNECHVVPANIDDSGHMDSAPAEVIWGPLARTDGGSPRFDRATASCSGVYCHGATLPPGGSNTRPTWTTVDGTQSGCGTCHGLPPQAPHPNASDCSTCHGMVVDSKLNFVDASLHIDGKVEVASIACNGCHGGASNSAPPIDTQGRSATTEVTIGAHQSHLGASTWHRQILCDECHVVPSSIGDAGHIDAAPAELTWGALAAAGGAAPSFNRTSATCSGVYCHGASLISGGSNTRPSWITVDGSQAACGTCHGLPPASPHPNSTECSLCHGMVIDTVGNFVDPSLHINGTVNVADLSCDSCHGSSGNSAPPADTSGRTSTTVVTVGAHRSHLTTSSWHRNVRCDDCHVVPAAVDSPGHLDAAPAELNWSTLARADGASPAFNRSAETCSGVYCHGATLLSGGSNTSPKWTTVNGSQAACGTCHGLPPAPPHAARTDCATCHGMVVASDLSFVNPALHINGVVDVNGTNCNSCHGSAANAAPPVDTQGLTSTLAVTVGAHQAHLQPSTWHQQLSCDECHVVPGTVNDPGHLDPSPAEVVWGALARADGAGPAFDRSAGSCSNVYCHGSTLTPGGTNVQPVWTTVNGTQAVCGTCHGLPPDPPHTARTDCSSCHGMVIDSNMEFVGPSLHINGVVESSGADCNQCHGGALNDAPPLDTQGLSSTAEVTVGAHQFHLGASTWHREVICSDCHVVPLKVDDPGHIDAAPAEVTWGAIARANGAAPAFDRLAESCSGVYCHGATLKTGGTNTRPSWTTVDGTQAACGTCHGLPPDPPHAARTDCATCHGMVVDTALNFVAPGLHINGVVNVNGTDCNSCHGSASNNAPPTDTQGRSATSFVTVGAHQAHLKTSTWHRQGACADCHTVPTTFEDPGHLDASPAEVTWGALAQAGGAAPAFNRSLATCSGVYCHGATLPPGGSRTVPSWITVDGTQATCGTCHGLPPGPPHPASSECSSCHGMVVDRNLAFLNPSLHINGNIEVSGTACNSCHGNEANAAPPLDTQGQSSTLAVTVGAHQSHLGASTWHHEVLCDDCHAVPDSVDSPGHLDPAPADLTWSALARADGASPAFDRAAMTCSGVYCHGASLMPGGSITRPRWTTVDGSQADCGTCHGLPPAAPHPPRADCGSCHGAVYDGANFVDPSLHIDGAVQVTGGCDTCHGNPPTPATESYAGAGGAHVRHVSGLGYGCAVCHGHNGDGPQHNEGGGRVLRGNVDIVFSAAVAFPGGTTMGNAGVPTESYNGGNPTCRVGCHNPIPGDTRDLANAAIWTDTSIACSECHERPGVSAPINHNIAGDDAAVRSNCQECHNISAHLSGALLYNDPDPTDGFSHAAQGTAGLCMTCHDGGPGTHFGGQVAMDVSTFWGVPSSHQQAGLDCQNCHGYHGSTAGANLIPNAEENLCYLCHDGDPAHTDIQALFQRTSRHPVADAEQGPYSVECTSCHDPHADSAAAPFIADPDPLDAITPSGLDSAYCLTCHDREQATDKTPFLSGAHSAAGMSCAPDCHIDGAGRDGVSAAPFGPHGSDYPALLAFAEERTCNGASCHASQILEMSQAGTFTHHHVVDAEQPAGVKPVECETCHDPHLVDNSPWQPLTDPHTGALVAAANVPRDYNDDPNAAFNDNGVFCLRCHDGSWTGAANIAAEMASSSVINSGFYRGTSNLHRLHRGQLGGRMACSYCHNAHGNTGTSGRVRRGALLYSWLNVLSYPYTGKSSCGTGDALHRCH